MERKWRSSTDCESRPTKLLRMSTSERLCLCLLLVVALLLPLVPLVAAQQVRKVFKLSEPVQLDNASSIELLRSVSKPGMSRIYCVGLCVQQGDCALAVFNTDSGLCRTLRLLKAPGSNGSHVIRRLGDEAGDEVWQSEDFSATVERLQSSASDRYAQVDNRTFRVIQNRLKGNLSFARSWTDYENGFGDDTDFWIGLRSIHELTGSTPRRLRVEAVTWSDVLYVSEHSGFTVGNVSTNYTMTVGGYQAASSNTSGDSLGAHRGMQFSTMDRDNDIHAQSCSNLLCGGGGWWYFSCSSSNPNGIYYTSPIINSEMAMYWQFVHDAKDSLKSIRLMLRV